LSPRSHVSAEEIKFQLPEELWKEIFKNFFTDELNAELLNLSLINKQCYNRVNEIFSSKLPLDLPTPQFNQYLNPKQFYYFNKSRDPRPRGALKTLIRLPQGFELNTKYAPWLDHNILRHPQNFWLFIKAVFCNPEWILPVLVKSLSITSFSEDYVNKKRILNYVNLCSVSLCSTFVFFIFISFQSIIKSLYEY
jgi:hypothetical protein